MKITYAPLVDSASGKFGGAIASPWRGVHTLRQLPTRPNPDTAKQLALRQIFANTSRAWTVQRLYTRAAWNFFAVGKNFTGRNAYLGKQVAALTGDTNLNHFLGSLGQPTTLPPLTISVTGGPAKIWVGITAPTPPTGWTLSRWVAISILNANWSAIVADVNQIEAWTYLPTTVLTLSPLTPGSLYQVRAWLIWTAPDASTRHSSSLATTATPT